MLIGYIVGALTMLVGVVAGHVLAKPWFDKHFNKALQTNKPKSGATP
jgi:hypothetical protein